MGPRSPMLHAADMFCFYHIQRCKVTARGTKIKGNIKNVYLLYLFWPLRRITKGHEYTVGQNSTHNDHAEKSEEGVKENMDYSGITKSLMSSNVAPQHLTLLKPGDDYVNILHLVVIIIFICCSTFHCLVFLCICGNKSGFMPGSLTVRGFSSNHQMASVRLPC